LHAEGREPLQGFRIMKIALDPPRAEVTERLNHRCIRMFEAGLIGEIEIILELGYPKTAKAFESIGYREAILHLNRELSLKQAIEATKVATRQYAKRQRTWFRREPGITWLQGFGNSLQTCESAISLVENFLKNS